MSSPSSLLQTCALCPCTSLLTNTYSPPPCLPSSVFQTVDRFCTQYFDPEDPADGFEYFGTAALATRAVSVTLNNRCTSNTICCTRVWCHSSNRNNCFDVRYSSSFIPPPAGKPPTPLTGGEIAAIVVCMLLFCSCMSAGIYIKNKLGISNEAAAALADAYLVTTNPISAATSVQSWGSSEAHGGVRHPQPSMEVVTFSPSSQQQPQGGMHRAAFAPQAYPMPGSLLPSDVQVR